MKHTDWTILPTIAESIGISLAVLGIAGLGFKVAYWVLDKLKVD